MSSILDKEKSCEPVEEKKCKETKKRVEKEIDCVEPQPPPVRDKVLFNKDSPDPIDQEREKCLKDCKVEPVYIKWKDCDRRVTTKLLYTAETCHDETVDLMEALDKCVGSKGFLRLE